MSHTPYVQLYLFTYQTDTFINKQLVKFFMLFCIVALPCDPWKSFFVFIMLVAHLWAFSKNRIKIVIPLVV